MKNKLFALLALPLFALPAAEAADNGLYLGGSIGRSAFSTDVDAGLTLPSFDEEDTGWKAIVGFRPLDWFAIEANYIDFGRIDGATGVVCPPTVGAPCPSRFAVDARAVSVSALGLLELPFADLYGRVGLARREVEGRISGTSLDLRERDRATDLSYGVGAQVRLLSFGVRLEWERFDLDDSDEVDMLSLGFTYTFL